MKALAILALVAVYVAPFPAFGDSLEVHEASFTGVQGEQVSVEVITIPLRIAHVEVLSAVGSSSAADRLGFTLDRVARAQRNRGETELLLVNGGPSSYRSDIPVGLL